MTTWNQFDPAVTMMVSTVRSIGSAWGKFANQPKATSYKEQAKIELARRLVLESQVSDLKATLDRHINLMEALDTPPILAAIKADAYAAGCYAKVIPPPAPEAR